MEPPRLAASRGGAAASSRGCATRARALVADADQQRGRALDRLVAAMRRRVGATAATGSRAKLMIRKPMTAFQKPIVVHGSVTANSATRTRSRNPNPPGPSAITASQIRPAMVAPTAAKNSAGRHIASGAGAATAISSPGESSTMARYGYRFGRFEERAACPGRASALARAKSRDPGPLEERPVVPSGATGSNQIVESLVKSRHCGFIFSISAIFQARCQRFNARSRALARE